MQVATQLRVLGLACLVCASAAAQSYTFTPFAGLPPQIGSADGVGTDARFYYPSFTVFDSAGNLFVTDSYNHTIRKITSAGVVTTFAGTAGQSGTADGTGATARFNRPYGIAIDGSGNLFVTDYNNHTIRRITSAGVVTTFAGLGGTSGTTDATGSAARFNNPQGIAIDSSGNLFVSDRAGRTVRKITSAGSVSTFAGLGGVSGSADGAGSNARFSLPEGIAVDSSGTVYVADNGAGTIRRITSAGVVSTLAGLAGNYGSTDGTGSTARFNSPAGIAVDSSGNLYVADAGNHNVRKITPSGSVNLFAGGTGTRGSAEGTGTSARFFSPVGVTLDASGNLYVADKHNHTIRLVTSAAVTSKFAGPGGTFGTADGTGTSARFNGPRGMVADSRGNLFVADYINSAIRKITPDGVVSTFAGAVGVSGSTDGTGSSARFFLPIGLCIDSSDNLYVADTGNSTIRKITSAGSVTTVAGSPLILGLADGAGSVARFFFPYGIACDGSGNLYVADTINYTIRKIVPNGTVSTIAGSATAPAGTTDGPGLTARFFLPTGITADAAGNVFIADNGNQTIRKIATDGTVSTLAGLAGVSGSADGKGSSARFFDPYNVTIDKSGNLFVADTDNHALRKIAPDGTVTTIGGTAGLLLPATSAGTGTSATVGFVAPIGVYVDSKGVVYATDDSASIIVKGVPDVTPDIFTQPKSVTTLLGSSTSFSVSATGGGLSYQWKLNGTAIAGATGTSYTVTSVTNSTAGSYTVDITNSVGKITSAAAVLTATPPGRLINLSILTPLAANETMTMGTVLGGTGTSGSKSVLARVVGPSLNQFGITAFLPDPTLTLNNTSASPAVVVATNNHWGGDAALSTAFTQLGAFAFTSASSNDSALYRNGATALASGNYTVQVTDKSGGAGTVLAELYDATASSAFDLNTPRLINVSVLKQIGAGASLTTGFVIGGTTNMKVLVRVVGPTLAAAPFNVNGTLVSPKLELFDNATGAKLNENTAWGGSTTLSTAFTSVGAFALANATTKDAALLVTLAPGQYSAKASGADGGGGLALVEVYEVP